MGMLLHRHNLKVEKPAEVPVPPVKEEHKEEPKRTRKKNK